VQVLQVKETFLDCTASAVSRFKVPDEDETHQENWYEKVHPVFWVLLGGASVAARADRVVYRDGRPAGPAVNTIEVDPVPVAVQGDCGP
jgi:hypothetical protein